MKKNIITILLTVVMSTIFYSTAAFAAESDMADTLSAKVGDDSLTVIEDLFETRLLEADILDNTDSTNDSGIIAGSVSDYLGATEAYAIYQLPLSAGQYLQAQLTVPNDANIDYDLYLMDSNGEIVAGGDSITHINGSDGTIPESLGYIESTGATYYIYVLSSNGGSSTLPYTLDYSISSSYDIYESDESYKERLMVGTLPTTGYTINTRNLSSPVDNEWYNITVPSGMGKLIISATTASVNTCKVEVYRNVSSDWYELSLVEPEDGMYELTQGNYAVRVCNALSMEDYDDNDIQNYTLSIMPTRTASSITIDSMSGTEGVKYVTYSAGGYLFRTGIGTVTVSGTAYNSSSQPQAYVPVTITYHNPNWSVPSWATVTANGYTDANGKYSISLVIPQAYGAYSEFVSVSTHYFDICTMKAEVTGSSNIYQSKNFYLFSHLIFR